ncbi:MAG: DUF2959 domain-containing protein [Methylococcales bacterium]|nr:DUF2959 domain-containing protein [Methylococcales bacterium]
MRCFSLVFISFLVGCSSLYYSGLEKIGIPKRQVMVHRVQQARDTQEETKQQFQSALERFTQLTRFQGGELETVYNQLNKDYQNSLDQAEEVHDKISAIEDVAEALFEEWRDEIAQYQNPKFRRDSQDKLTATRQRYQRLLTAMKAAEAKLEPILVVFKDHVLFLKHNLNAQAIAALRSELDSIEGDVSRLIKAMQTSIDEANAFIASMEPS